MKKLLDELSKLKEGFTIPPRDFERGYCAGVEDALDIIKRHDSWISVKNELPPLREGLYADGVRSNTVLIRGFTAYAMGRYNYKKKNWERIDGEDISEVTDWMPIYEKGLL